MQDSEIFLLTNENKTLSGVDELKCPAEVYVPTGVTKIDRRAFASCPAKKIFLPDTVTQIGYEAFYGCDALEYVRFPKKIESIEPAIFRECFSLQKVELGDEISAFSESMFECCYSLEEAPFRIGITELPRNLFSECASLESLVIPEGVAVIKSGAAAYCQNLSTLVLPSSMRIIEDDAFRNCVNLAHIRFSAENPVFFTDEESGALFERHDDGTFSLIKVPVKATQIRIPKNVTHSHSEAFQGCDSIEKVYIDCAMVDHPLFVALKTEIVDAEFINENEAVAEKQISPETEIEKNEAEETPILEENADSETQAEKEEPQKKPRKPREKKRKPDVIEEAISEEPSELREEKPDSEKSADAETQAEKEEPQKKPRKPREKKRKPVVIEETLSDEPSEPQIKIEMPVLETSSDEFEIAFEPQIEEPSETEELSDAAESEAVSE
ncbi:MAG: leucine-rich repeat protein, partial [Treponemataceae bacterium]|nr:leucine-rich repeat protein [Treponemataceae bacterium]